MSSLVDDVAVPFEDRSELGPVAADYEVSPQGVFCGTQVDAGGIEKVGRWVLYSEVLEDHPAIQVRLGGQADRLGLGCAFLLEDHGQNG